LIFEIWMILFEALVLRILYLFRIRKVQARRHHLGQRHNWVSQ
jgi:hypothetical protein